MNRWLIVAIAAPLACLLVAWAHTANKSETVTSSSSASQTPMDKQPTGSAGAAQNLDTAQSTMGSSTTNQITTTDTTTTGNGGFIEHFGSQMASAFFTALTAGFQRQDYINFLETRLKKMLFQSGWITS